MTTTDFDARAATWDDDPIKAARLMIAHMDKRRAALKLPPVMYPPREPGAVPAEAAAAVG